MKFYTIHKYVHINTAKILDNVNLSDYDIIDTKVTYEVKNDWTIKTITKFLNESKQLKLW